MSVISSHNVQCWQAPVSTGQQTICITGSWEWQHPGSASDWQLCETRVCHLRLGTWKQQVGRVIVPAALDLSIRNYGTGAYKCEIELKVASKSVPPEFITTAEEKVVTLLNQSPHARTILACFQHAQPGASLSVGVIGKAGRDGAIQSD